MVHRPQAVLVVINMGFDIAMQVHHLFLQKIVFLFKLQVKNNLSDFAYACQNFINISACLYFLIQTA